MYDTFLLFLTFAAEALSREYEAKINKLVAAVKSERGTLRLKLDEAVAKTQTESERVAVLQARISQLEAEKRLMASAPSPVVTTETPFAEAASAPSGPPPPPPPAPALKLIDSSKITVSKGSGKSEERPKDPKAESMTNLIAEIKGGVKLKAAAPRTAAPPASKL
jgi:hypothetical protein